MLQNEDLPIESNYFNNRLWGSKCKRGMIQSRQRRMMRQGNPTSSFCLASLPRPFPAFSSPAILLCLFCALLPSSDSKLSELESSESEPELAPPESEPELLESELELESSELLPDPLELLESEPEEELEPELDPEESSLSADTEAVSNLYMGSQLRVLIRHVQVSSHTCFPQEQDISMARM